MATADYGFLILLDTLWGNITQCTWLKEGKVYSWDNLVKMNVVSAIKSLKLKIQSKLNQ